MGKQKFRRLAYTVVGVLANIFRVAEATAGVADVHVHWRGYQPSWPEQVRYSDPAEPLALVMPPPRPRGVWAISIEPESLRDEGPPPPAFYSLVLNDCGSSPYKLPPEPPPPYVEPPRDKSGLTADQRQKSSGSMNEALTPFHLTKEQDLSVREYLGQGKFEITDLPMNGGVNLILRDPKTHEYRGDAFVKPGPDGSIVVSKTTGHEGFDTSKKAELPYSQQASDEAQKVLGGSESLNTFDKNWGKLGDKEGEPKEPGKDIFVPVAAAEAKGEYGAVSESHAVFQPDGHGYEYGLKTDLAEGGAEGSVGAGEKSDGSGGFAGAKGAVGANALKVEVYANYFSPPTPDGEGHYVRNVVGASGEAHTTLAEVGAKLGCSGEKGCGAGWSLGLLGIGTGMALNYNIGQKLPVETEGAVAPHGLASTPAEVQQAEQAARQSDTPADGAPTNGATPQDDSQTSGEDDADESDDDTSDQDDTDASTGPPPQAAAPEGAAAESGAVEPYSQNPPATVEGSPVGAAPEKPNSALEQAQHPNWDGAAPRDSDVEEYPLPPPPPEPQGKSVGEPAGQDDGQAAQPDDQNSEPDHGAGDEAQPNDDTTEPQNQTTEPDEQNVQPDEENTQPDEQPAQSDDQNGEPDEGTPPEDTNGAQTDDNSSPSGEQPAGDQSDIDPEAVKERQDYNAAVKDGSAEALQHFLDQYPDSSYDTDVHDRIEGVESRENGDTSSDDQDNNAKPDDNATPDDGGSTTDNGDSATTDDGVSAKPDDSAASGDTSNRDDNSTVNPDDEKHSY